MGMTIMAAPAAGGKSQACIAWLLERLRPAWRVQQVPEAALIAPNRLLRSHLRRRLQQQASIGITIADFAEVCQALIAAGGRPYRLARRPLVRQLIAQAMIACAGEQLAQGRTSSLSPTRGVIDLVDAAIADLKHGLVTPDAVHAVADDPLTATLAMIYRRYQHRLEQAGLEDRAGLLWRAIQALHDPACRIPWATIAVDGFDSFLPAQRALLARLAERAEVFVTVPWSATTATMPQRVAHGRFATTRERLGATCRDATYQELRDSRLAPLLDRIERTLFEPMPPHETTRASPQPLTDAGAPCALWQLETRAAEVREVLRALEAAGRRSVLVCGVEAHVCVLQTVLDLRAAGHRVFHATDAISSGQADQVPHAFRRMELAGAVPTGTLGAMYELVGDAADPRFREILALAKQVVRDA